MSRKKIRGNQTASPSSSGDKNSRRGRLSALFGRGPEDFDDTAQYSSALEQEVEPTKGGFTNSSEKDCQIKKSASTQTDEHTIKATQESNSAGVDDHQSVGEKMVLKLDTPSPANTTVAIDFAEGVQDSSDGKGASEDHFSPGKTSGHDTAFNNITQTAIPSLLTPSRATRSSIHRHKRASSSFKIVDKDTADAVLLPAVSYTASSSENRDSAYNKKHAGAKGQMQSGVSDQSPIINQKQLEKVQLLPSKPCRKTVFPRSNHVKVSHSDKDTGENTYLLPMATYIPSEVMDSIPETPQNNVMLTEKGPVQFSTSFVEPRNTLSTSQDDKEPVEGNYLPHPNSHVPSTPLHGVLKATTSNKVLADKKVRFAVASSSKTVKVEDNSGDSDDSDQTIKPGVDDMKVVPDSVLSPVIWDKGSEPKIWLKEGKPTLFKPKKEPDYYTSPLWSRQYPEIFSNEPRVNTHTAAYAESTASTDGSQCSETCVPDSNVNPRTSTNRYMKTESNTEMSFDAGTPAPRAAFTRTPGSVNTLPTPASHTFVGQDFPEHTNATPAFALTPRYRTQVKVEVGGRRFVSTFEVLEKSPWFRHLFSIDFRNWYHDGVFHIDNDGDLFAHVIRYLRTDLYPLFWDSCNGFDYAMYAMIKQQAHHYMLYDLEAWIVAQKFHDVVETQVVHQKVLIPHNQEWVHEQRLMGNHSYVISGVIDQAKPRNHLQNGAQATAAGHYKSDNDETYGQKNKATVIEGLNTDIDSAVVLFTTEKIVKVDMDQLHRA